MELEIVNTPVHASQFWSYVLICAGLSANLLCCAIVSRILNRTKLTDIRDCVKNFLESAESDNILVLHTETYVKTHRRKGPSEYFYEDEKFVDIMAACIISAMYLRLNNMYPGVFVLDLFLNIRYKNGKILNVLTTENLFESIPDSFCINMRNLYTVKKNSDTYEVDLTQVKDMYKSISKYVEL